VGTGVLLSQRSIKISEQAKEGYAEDAESTSWYYLMEKKKKENTQLVEIESSVLFNRD
jgi:hypothetical protein